MQSDVVNWKLLSSIEYTVDICRYENLESLGKCFAPFVCMHLLPSKFQGITFKCARDHPFKTSAGLRGGGVSPCADGLKVTVHKYQKSPS